MITMTITIAIPIMHVITSYDDEKQRMPEEHGFPSDLRGRKQ